MSDILVDIPDEDLPKLAALYEKHQSWAPHVFSFIHIGMRWKQSERYRNKIKFMSPNNCWQEDGTIIVLMEFYCHDFLVFTLDDSCENLFKGLLESKRIHYSVGTSFFAPHQKHVSTIVKVLDIKNITNRSFGPCTMYALSPEEAKKFIWELPPHVYSKPLEPCHAQQINSVWPHRYPNSDKYIATLIEMNGGEGIFLKSNNKLVCWVVRHCYGQLGMLQTDEEYKRKGYAVLATKILSKKIADEGFWPLGTIVVNNRPSEILFEKLNFEAIGNYCFVDLK